MRAFHTSTRFPYRNTEITIRYMRMKTVSRVMIHQSISVFAGTIK